MIHRLANSRLSGGPARFVLAFLMLFAMSAPLLHVHAAHDHAAECRSTLLAVAAADDHADKRHSAPTDHPAGGLDCCVHQGSLASTDAGMPVITRYDVASGRIAIPDDLVLDATPASRLERPPRSFLST